MSPDRRKCLRVFRQALSLPKSERAVYLLDACGDDDALRREVDVFLDRHQRLERRGDLRITDADALPSESVHQTYEILEQLGRGNTGVVVKARDPNGRTVAIKYVKKGVHVTPEESKRFENEIHAIHSLSHAGIVTVYGVADLPEGNRGIVMEYLAGGTLSEKIDGVPQETRWAADIVSKVAFAAHYAHGSGIVHRDLSARNILLTDSGQPKIVDFGVALLAAGESRLTLPNQVIGTPAYMSPEQAAGRAAEVDGRADVYSLGVVLYEALVGHTPFPGGPTDEVLAQVLKAEPVSPKMLRPTIPRDLDTICLKCLEKLPSRRYQTAEDLAGDLVCWLENRPIRARRVGYFGKLYRFCRRRPAAAAAAFMMLTLIIGVLGTLIWNNAARANRLAATNRSVNPVLQQLFQEWSEAKATPSSDVGLWDKAAATTWSLERLVAEREVEPELLSQVNETIERFRSDEITGRAKAETARLKNVELLRDARFIKELEVARNSVVQNDAGTLDYKAIDKAYRDIFLRYDLDVLSMSRPDAVERIKNRSNHLEISAMLDAWAIARSQSGHSGWRELLLMSLDLDKDEQRSDIRLAIADRKYDTIELLVQRKKTQELPVSTAILLSNTLLGIRKPAVAIKLLGPLQTRFPNEYWINHTLGIAWLQIDGPYWGGALQAFSAALASRSDSASSHINLGIAYRRSRNLHQASEMFRNAIRLEPENAVAHFHYGATHDEAGRFDEARDEFHKASVYAPDNPHAHHHHGRMCLITGRKSEGIASLKRSLVLDPSNTSTLALLADILVLDMKYAEAIALYDDAIRHDRHNIRALYGLSKVLRLSNDHDDAIIGTSAVVAGMASPFQGIAIAIYAHARERRDPDTPLKEAERLNQGTADDHSRRGQIAFEDENYKLAESEYRKALVLDPTRTSSHLSLARTHEMLGEHHIALADMRRARHFSPADGAVALSLGKLLMTRGYAEEAVAHLRASTILSPNNPDTFHTLGYALLQSGKTEEAMQAYLQVFKLDEDHYETCIEVSEVFAWHNDRDAAFDAMALALRRDRDSPRTEYGIAVLHLNFHEYEMARDTCARLIRKHPDYIQGYYVFANALLKCGRYQEAYEQYRAALLKVRPGTTAARRLKEGIARAHEMNALARQLDGVIMGQTQLSQEDLRECAGILLATGRYESSAKLYYRANVLNAPSDDPILRFGVVRARAALLKSRWAHDESCVLLKQMQNDISEWTKHIENKTPYARAYARSTLKAWLRCSEMKYLQTQEFLSKIPYNDQLAWRQLWRQVRVCYTATDSITDIHTELSTTNDLWFCLVE